MGSKNRKRMMNDGLPWCGEYVLGGEDGRALLAERDALFRNPRAKEAREYWDRRGWPPPVDPSVPLAIVHKARLQWLEATDRMLEESRQWLLARGYEPTMAGAPPLTPEKRDADRAALGKPPLSQ